MSNFDPRTETHLTLRARCQHSPPHNAGVRRSKSLPDGGSLPPEQQSTLACELRHTLDWVQSQNELLFSRTPASSELWNDRYDALSQGREDAYGTAGSRAEAQVLRLSAIYAALDRSPLINACHLEAALAVCLLSRQRPPPLRHRLHRSHPAASARALDVTPEGLSRVQIRRLFHRHVSKERIDLALEQLPSLGLINRETATGQNGPQLSGPKYKNRKSGANTPEPDPYGA